MPNDRIIPPYRAAARGYFDNGLFPIPIPYMDKKPPPTGYTGEDHPYEVTAEDIEVWRARKAANIASEVPPGVVVIDVDGEAGIETLTELERKYGELPATWVVGRGDPYKFHMWFRCPDDMVWPANAVGIDFRQPGASYVMLPPSMHPSEKPYEWYRPNLWRDRFDDPADFAEIPAIPDDLTEIPEEWLDLKAERRRTAARNPNVDARQWIEKHGKGAISPRLKEIVKRRRAELRNAAEDTGIHPAVRDGVWEIVNEIQNGQRGGIRALELLRTTFYEAREASGRDVHRMERDWSEVCFSAVEKVAIDDLFWGARPELKYIRDFARSRKTAPWAVLACVLCRVVDVMSPRVVLPPLRGSVASLNLYVGLVGRSSGGKSTAISASRDVFPIFESGYERTPGTGNGIAHMFAHFEKGQVVYDRSSVIFTESEVDNIAAERSRQGSNLLPELRKAWSGERLGFQYADATKSLPIPEHEYRLTLLVGIQPMRAGVLLDAVDGGTPQRFIWAPTTDPDRPSETPAPPRRMKWSPPVRPQEPDPYVMEVCQDATDEIWEQAELDLDDAASDNLYGHILLNQLKVAAALAILDRRLNVDSEDWRLARMVIEKSKQTVEYVRGELAKRKHEENVSRGKAEGVRAVHAAETKERLMVPKVRSMILRKLAESEEWKALPSMEFGPRYRVHFTKAVETLIANGKVERRKNPKAKGYQYRLTR